MILKQKIQDIDSEIISVKNLLFGILNSSKRAEEDDITKMQQLQIECKQINKYITEDFNASENDPFDSVENTLQGLSNEYQKTLKKADKEEKEYNEKYSEYINIKKSAKNKIQTRNEIISKKLEWKKQINQLKSNDGQAGYLRFKKEIHSIVEYAKNASVTVLKNYYNAKIREASKVGTKIEKLRSNETNKAYKVRSICLKSIEAKFISINTNINIICRKICTINEKINRLIEFQKSVIHSNNISCMRSLMLGAFTLYTKKLLESSSYEFQRRCIEEDDLISEKPTFPEDKELIRMENELKIEKDKYDKKLKESRNGQENIKRDLLEEIRRLEQSLRED